MVVNTRRNPRRDQEFEESRRHLESEISMAGSLPINNQPQIVLNGQQGQNGLNRAMAIDPNHVVVKDVTKVIGGPVLRSNLSTLLEIQQLI
ncbi:hypothetical protein L3X38_016450 [Prunus dulcis]|uniref:Uncharacterized protein n=1 Tax=Prunus dulcis TaxID=3755 RepID=A0AAD4W5Z2_PRUDU|nr:hypothetical protein L3X38_016450 [Prunus dulcis]